MRKPMARMAVRILQAMAYDRETFKNKCQHHLIGAIIHFYRIQLAKRAGQKEWTEHWTKEAKRLVEDELLFEIVHQVRGFRDLRKAFNEAVAETQQGDSSFRHSAETTVKDDYGLKKLREGINDQDTKSFWQYVKKHADRALESKGF